jgi:hypothetical protein
MTAIESGIPAQREYLQRLVRCLDMQLASAVANGANIRPDFVQTWAAWYENFRATMATQQPWTIPMADALSTRVEQWVEWFLGEGVDLASCARDMDERVAAGLELPFGLGRIWTPSAIHSELEKAKTWVMAVDSDVQATAQKFPADAQQWNAFRDEFLAWYKSGPSTLWGATATKAQEYEDRATDWRKRFQSLGATLHGVNAPGDARMPGAGPNAPSAGLLHAAEIIVGGLVLVTGLAVASQYIPKPPVRYVPAGA